MHFSPRRQNTPRNTSRRASTLIPAPPLPSHPAGVSAQGAAFLATVLSIDPAARPSCAELLAHPFVAERAGGGSGGGGAVGGQSERPASGREEVQEESL